MIEEIVFITVVLWYMVYNYCCNSYIFTLKPKNITLNINVPQWVDSMSKMHITTMSFIWILYAQLHKTTSKMLVVFDKMNHIYYSRCICSLPKKTINDPLTPVLKSGTVAAEIILVSGQRSRKILLSKPP